MGSVGEPINPEAWEWYYKKIGNSRCPIVDTWWQTAKEWSGGGTRFQFGRTRQRRDHEAAGFGLPPGINNRAAAVADFLVVPLCRVRPN